MQNNLLHILIVSGAVLGLFAVGEILYKFFHVKAEYTRKLIHAGTGFITLLCPLLFNNHWYVLGLCISFEVLLFLSMRFKFLNAINNIGRESFGSLAYPVSVYMCFLIYLHFQDKFFFYLPMLVLAIADPLAALCGTKWKYGKYRITNETKTFFGSLMFFAAACLITTACLVFHAGLAGGRSVEFILAVSVISTAAESFTIKGLDNLTIPAAIQLLLLSGIVAF